MSVSFILYLILLASIACISVLRFNRLRLPFKLLAAVIGITLLSETVSGITKMVGFNYIPIYHYFSMVQYAGTILVFTTLLKEHYIKLIAFWSIIPVCLLSFFNSIYFQDIQTFPSNILLINYGIFLVLSLFLFKEMMEEPLEQNLFRQPIFWFAAAYLFFPPAVFMSFGLQNYFKRNQLDLTALNQLISMTNFIFYTLLGMTFLTDQQKKKDILNDTTE